MVILLVAMAFFAVLAQFSLIVARFRRAMFFWGLVLATEVAFVVIVVMRIVAALFIVVVAIAAARLAIFGLIAALLVGVLGLYVWVSLALPVDLPTLLVSECRARAVFLLLLLAALFLQVLLLTSILSSREF